MGLFRWLKHLFGHEEKRKLAECTEKPAPQAIETSTPIPAPTTATGVAEGSGSRSAPTSNPVHPEETAGWKGRLILSSEDLMQMARKLQSKGELYRAEQLLRDGVKDAVEDLEFWWLLVEVEEPLDRKGRAYYCIEQILQRNAEDERAQQKLEELRDWVDTDLSYFIEYKLAPEFYRLK